MIKTAFPLLIAAAGFVWLPAEASAYAGGITGAGTIFYAVDGCTCHGNGTPSDATSLSLSSAAGKFEVEPGATLTLTLQVSHASQAGAGLNVVVVDGNMQRVGTFEPNTADGVRTGPGNREVTHINRKGMVNGKATFTFTWTAPSTPGTYTIHAAGNAVNGNGHADQGDAFNIMSQTITVGPVTGVDDNTVADNKFLHSVDIAPSPASAVEGVAELRYRLGRASTVTIELYDATGRPVQPAETRTEMEGDRVAVIDTRRLAGGMYIVVLRAGNEQIAKHFAVVR